MADCPWPHLLKLDCPGKAFRMKYTSSLGTVFFFNTSSCIFLYVAFFAKLVENTGKLADETHQF